MKKILLAVLVVLTASAFAQMKINVYKKIDGNIDTFLSTMDKIDYFIKYPDVVKKIREDYGK